MVGWLGGIFTAGWEAWLQGGTFSARAGLGVQCTQGWRSDSPPAPTRKFPLIKYLTTHYIWHLELCNKAYRGRFHPVRTGGGFDQRSFHTPAQ